MNLKTSVLLSALALSSLSAVQAQTTLTAWNFDNLSLAVNAKPQPSTGLGSAAVLGLGGSSSPTVVSQSGSSVGGAQAWSVGNTGGSSVGWGTNAAIGTQGAQFAASTLGYYQIQVSFDVYARTYSEAALLVQYSQDGTYWQNANITSAGTAGILATNNNPANGIVTNCAYLLLTNSGAAGWNNGVKINLTGIPGVANDPYFAIRIVNAATGTNCLNVAGTFYNSASGGDWTLDNVAVKGVSFDTVANWTFDNIGTLNPDNNPIPEISNNLANAFCFGFGVPTNHLVSTTFGTGTSGWSTNGADITSMGSGPYTSSGSAGKYAWRLRGQKGNGWLSTQPIGSQGAEIDVDTTHYTNILVTFDLYFTTQGEARMCVLYTTNAWTSTNVAVLACSSYPNLIQVNTPTYASESRGYSANTVNGYYIDNNIGSLFYNYMSVDFTGLPGVGNNPNFGFRVVNAATGSDCVNYIGQPYNNNSGNARIDNVAVNGQFSGQIAPVITNAPLVSVDGPFTNTFSLNAGDNDLGWNTNVSSIYVNGVLLPKTAYVLTASNIVFTPSASAPALTVAGLDYIVINATNNYTSAKYVQYVATGVAKSLSYIQVGGPSASGGTLITNPVFTVTDQYGNPTTNPYVNMVVTATVSNTPATWVLGGSTVQSMNNGYCTFTDLTATVIGSSAVNNAVIQFQISGYTNAATLGNILTNYSTAFTIGAPPGKFTQGNLAAIQVDSLGGNSTFSVIEVNPTLSGQSVPVNINPITATGANALRISTGGGAGHLALSDDHTFLVFGAYDDNSSATPDETFNLNRAVGTMNGTNGFTKTGKYVSNSLGGSAPRAACSPDNQDFLIDDKGGLYVYSPSYGSGYNAYEQNNYCVRSFGGSAWSMTQKVVAYVNSPAVFQFNNGAIGQLDYHNTGNDAPWIITTLTPPPDPLAVDFYMISTNGSRVPSSFAILYIIENNGGFGTNGVINKFQRNAVDDSWTAIGSWTNFDNANSLFATTNGTGGVYLYYANGTKDANSIVRVTDSSVTGAINITATNILYTAHAGQTVFGIVSVPLTNNLLAPFLTAQAGVIAGQPFTITCTPDDSAWRAAITNITMNGTSLPSSAYDTTQAGGINFNPAASPLLQSAGSSNIVISATVYGNDSVVQPLGAPATPKMGGVALTGGALKFAFTNFTGLSSSFTVLATNNVTAPRATWPPLPGAVVVENPEGSGNYQFTDSNPATNGLRYYLLSHP